MWLYIYKLVYMDISIKNKSFGQLLFFNKHLFAILLFSFFLPAHASNTEPQGWRYHEDQQSGFYIQYPAHWITKPPRGNRYVKIKVSSNANDKANCYVALTESSDTTSGSEQILQEVRQRFPDAELLETGLVTLDNCSANFVHVTMAFDGFNNQISIHNVITRVEKNDLIYTITCGSFSSGFEKIEPVFWQIIQSFGLLD